MSKLQIPPNSYFFKEENGEILFCMGGYDYEWDNIKEIVEGLPPDQEKYYRRLIATCACYEWSENESDLSTAYIEESKWREWGGYHNV